MDFLMCLSPFNGSQLGIECLFINITTVWLTFNPCTAPCLAPLWHFRRSRRVLVNCLSPRQSIHHHKGVTTGRRVSVSVCRRGGGVCAPDFQDILKKGPILSPSFPWIGYIWFNNYGLELSLVSEAWNARTLRWYRKTEAYVCGEKRKKYINFVGVNRYF